MQAKQPSRVAVAGRFLFNVVVYGTIAPLLLIAAVAFTFWGLGQVGIITPNG